MLRTLSTARPARTCQTSAWSRLRDGVAVEAWLDQHNLTLAAPLGPSRLALVHGEETAFAALADDPDVTMALPNARMAGASSQSNLADLQWHRELMDPPALSAQGRDFVVAVLDTGVAYETAVRDGVAYTMAPSLANSAIHAPYDFVNHDPHANDDHQHGTHIASLIASDGAVLGSAPGVGLMPIKVLDDRNQGTEYALVSGLWHAIQHDADVINMSLSFSEGYVASPLLREALLAAYEANIVMVAAAGNSGMDEVSWPAASPLVLSVGASHIQDGFTGHDRLELPGYTNLSGANRMLAPGGSMVTDHNRDGLPDGLLAESISPQNPSEVGMWLMAGTSQSAALASGAVVQLLDDGVPPEEVATTLQDHGDWRGYRSGRGGGSIDLDTESDLTSDKRSTTFYVSVVPFLEPIGSRADPEAVIYAFDEQGDPVQGLDVLVSFRGPTHHHDECTTDELGRCMASGLSTAGTDAHGQPIPLGVDGVGGGRRARRSTL